MKWPPKYSKEEVHKEFEKSGVRVDFSDISHFFNRSEFTPIKDVELKLIETLISVGASVFGMKEETVKNSISGHTLDTIMVGFGKSFSIEDVKISFMRKSVQKVQGGLSVINFIEPLDEWMMVRGRIMGKIVEMEEKERAEEERIKESIKEYQELKVKALGIFNDAKGKLSKWPGTIHEALAISRMVALRHLTEEEALRERGRIIDEVMKEEEERMKKTTPGERRRVINLIKSMREVMSYTTKCKCAKKALDVTLEHYFEEK